MLVVGCGCKETVLRCCEHGNGKSVSAGLAAGARGAPRRPGAALRPRPSGCACRSCRCATRCSGGGHGVVCTAPAEGAQQGPTGAAGGPRRQPAARPSPGLSPRPACCSGAVPSECSLRSSPAPVAHQSAGPLNHLSAVRAALAAGVDAAQHQPADAATRSLAGALQGRFIRVAWLHGGAAEPRRVA